MVTSFKEVQYDSLRVDNARKKGVLIVAESWLIESVEKGEKVAEGPHILCESEVCYGCLHVAISSSQVCSHGKNPYKASQK